MGRSREWYLSWEALERTRLVEERGLDPMEAARQARDHVVVRIAFDRPLRYPVMFCAGCGGPLVPLPVKARRLTDKQKERARAHLCATCVPVLAGNRGHLWVHEGCINKVRQIVRDRAEAWLMNDPHVDDEEDGNCRSRE